MTSPNYSPRQLYPGNASRDRPDIARATPQYRSGISDIEQRYAALNDHAVIASPSSIRRFLSTDVRKLMNIARAADRWARATNAEAARQAAEALHAALRGQ
jgi:hypothetical protein